MWSMETSSKSHRNAQWECGQPRIRLRRNDDDGVDVSALEMKKPQTRTRSRCGSSGCLRHSTRTERAAQDDVDVPI